MKHNLKRVISAISAIACLGNIAPLSGFSELGTGNADGTFANWVDVTFDNTGAYGTSCIGLTDKGELYVWGVGEYISTNNYTAQNRLKPTKVDFDYNVIDINRDYVLTDTGSVYYFDFDSANPTGTLVLSHVKKLCKNSAITEDGALYLLCNGQQLMYDGNGNQVSSNDAIKVEGLENVVSADNTFYSVAAVTEDGSLYTWGSNQMAQGYGNGHLGYISRNPELEEGSQVELLPKKVEAIDNVVDAKFDDVATMDLYVLKNDGVLYKNNYIYGSDKISFEPLFENVANFEGASSFHGGGEVMAISNNEELFVDGFSIWGFGDGAEPTEYQNIRKQLTQFGAVRNVAVSGNDFAVVTADGNLYTWGQNNSGVIGNGKLSQGDMELGVPASDDVFTPYQVPNPATESSDVVEEEEPQTEFKPSDRNVSMAQYQNILDMYYKNISENWENFDENNGAYGVNNLTNENVSYLWEQYASDKELSEVGYQFIDLNGDGVEELIVSIISDATDIIYDIYTVDNNGNVVHLGASARKCTLCLDDKNQVIQEENTSTFTSVFSKYRVADGTLKPFEVYMADANNTEDGSLYFYAKNPDESYYNEEGFLISSKMKAITEEQFNNAVDNTVHQSLNLTPFSEYYNAPSATSGQCGDDAYWNFDENTGILTISGTGKMYNYYTLGTNVPWSALSSKIKRVNVEDGITEFFFDFLNQDRYLNLTTLVVPASVKLLTEPTTKTEKAELRDLEKNYTIYGFTGTAAQIFSYTNNYNVPFYPLNGQVSVSVAPAEMHVCYLGEEEGYDNHITKATIIVENYGKYDLNNVVVDLDLPEGVGCTAIEAGYEEINGEMVQTTLPDFRITGEGNQQIKFKLEKAPEQEGEIKNNKAIFDITLYVSDDIINKNYTGYSHRWSQNTVTIGVTASAEEELNTNPVTKDMVSTIYAPEVTRNGSFEIVHDGTFNNELTELDIFRFKNREIDFFNYKESTPDSYYEKYGKYTNHYYFDSDDTEYYADEPSELEFEDKEENKTQISKDAYKILLQTFDNNVVKAFVTEKKGEVWGGSCHGMSAVVPLVKSGYLNLDEERLELEADEDANSKISGLALPKTDSKVEDLINFYALQQFLPGYINDTEAFFGVEEEEEEEGEEETTEATEENEEEEDSDIDVNFQNDLKKIVEETKKVNKNGLPVRVNYAYEKYFEDDDVFKTYGHSIVTYACQYIHVTDDEGNYEFVDSEEDPNFDEYLISAYDSSLMYSQEYIPTFMRISKDFNSCSFEDQPIRQIRNVTSDVNKMSLICFDDEYVTDACDKEFSRNFLSGTATNWNVKVEAYDLDCYIAEIGQGQDGDLYTYTLPDACMIYSNDGDQTPANSYTTYFEDDFDNDDLRLTLDEKGACDFDMVYTNSMVSAGGSNVSQIDFDADGIVEVQGENSDYEVGVSFNEDYMPLPWYTVSASGKEANNVKMETVSNGFVLTNENMNDVTVNANDDDKELEVNFSIAEVDHVWITNNAEKLAVYADVDNDGTYETLLAEAGPKSDEDEEQATETQGDTQNGTQSATEDGGDGGHGGGGGDGDGTNGDTGDDIGKSFAALLLAVSGMALFKRKRKD